MKRVILLVVALVLSFATAEAQQEERHSQGVFTETTTVTRTKIEKVKKDRSEKFNSSQGYKNSIGINLGSGAKLQYERYLYNGNYIEARFGAAWNNGGGTVTADFTALYNWRIVEMDWTPRAGRWFFDAGCGINVGGKAHYAYVGAAGMARLGLKFNAAPVSLSLDWTPVFGAAIGYGGGYSAADFHKYGLANLGITCTYHF